MRCSWLPRFRGACDTDTKPAPTAPLSVGRPWPLFAVAAILLTSAALRFTHLPGLGYANHYYAAAVKSMLQSWHNFFFVAAEPGGSVSVDKPPLGLWLQASSASLLGVNTLGLLLPQLLAGTLSIALLYHLVRRSHGTTAGLLAALALAVTPVTVATDRNNTIDSTLVFVLLLAAWAFAKATEAGRPKHLVLGTAMVGLAFNVKMLQAFLPLPAYVTLYFLGSDQRFLHKIGRLALALVVLASVSLSWAIAVDLTPADRRPYVGSSSDNSELGLIAGYNGIQRLLGIGTRPLGSSAHGAEGQAQVVPGGSPQPGVRRPNAWGPGSPPDGGPAHLPGTGRPGLARLFVPPLSKETSWLLPFALVGAVALALAARPRWPLAAPHRALVLWGGWLLTGTAFFSVARFFHEHYLAMLAPPIAALLGLGVIELWRLRLRYRWLAVGLALAAAAATLALQVSTAQAFLPSMCWWPLPAVLAAAGSIMLAQQLQPRHRLAKAGLGCIVAAALVLPAFWSTVTAIRPSDNSALPAAYSGQSSAPPATGVLRVDPALLEYLESRTHGVRYLMAVPSSMQGADYVLATGRPILYLGGFNGADPVVDVTGLGELVASGQLRFVYWSTPEQGPGSRPDISSWIASSCAPVDGFAGAIPAFGAPGGTAATGFAAMTGRLFDCGTAGW